MVRSPIPLILSSLLVFSATLRDAVADPREEEMFGDQEAVTELSPDRSNPGESDRDEWLLGEGSGSQAPSVSLAGEQDDRLQIGGMMYLRLSGTQLQESRAPTLTSPNLVDLYLDTRPSDRLRGFVRGRLTYNPMTTSLLPGLVPEGDEVVTTLDQLWVSFDVASRLYVTVGKQSVRWGASRLWNPVDVVNPTRRDPLALFDERTGVPMVKMHLPLESVGIQVTGLVLMNDVSRADDLGLALRVESVFSTVQLGISGTWRDGGDPLVGLDVSAGVWDFDVTGEAAVRFGEAYHGGGWGELDGNEAVFQGSLGIEYAWKYNAEDYLGLGVEYFHNPDGLDEKAQYLPAMMGGTASFFYMARHYAAFLLLLPSPGSWDSTSFVLSNVGNLSDRSFLSRLDVSTRVLTWMTLQIYTAVHYGTRGGEFRFGLDPVPPEIQALAALAGVGSISPVPYQLVDFGVNLMISL